jgi:hypothetical protein
LLLSVFFVFVFLQSLAAPMIPVVHIPADVFPVPLPGVGLVFLPLKYLALAGILIAIVLAMPLFNRYGAKLVYFIFLLSILLPGYELLSDVYTKYFLRH